MNLATKMNANDKKAGNPGKSTGKLVRATGVHRNCAKSPHFWRQKYKGNLTNRIGRTMVHQYPEEKSLQKSTFLATKMDSSDKKTGRSRKSGLAQVCITGICRNCAKSPQFWRQKYKGILDDHIQQITIFRYLKKKLFRKSTFLATKMSVNDKNQGNPSKSARHLSCSIGVHQNCSKSPHFRRQKYR